MLTSRRGFSRRPGGGRSDAALAAALPLALTIAATIAFAAAYAALAILRHEALGSNALDLGYEDQVLWNTLHGRWFSFSILSGGGFSLDYQAPLDHAPTNLLAYHAELLLAPLSLLYAVVPDVRALLAFQAIVVCVGAVAAYDLASHRLGSRWAGCFVALAYLGSPFLEAELLSDFHTVALDSALLLLLFTLIERRWLLPALVVGVAVAAAKEDAPVILALVGAWAALRRGWRGGGLGLLLIGLAFAALDFGVLIPHFSGGHGSPFLTRYGYLGATPRAMLAHVLRHPAALGPTLGSAESRGYLAVLLGSGGIFALLAPLTLVIALPSLAVNLLSSFPWMRTGMAHYSALVLPVLIAAAVEGIRNAARFAGGLERRWRATSTQGWESSEWSGRPRVMNVLALLGYWRASRRGGPPWPPCSGGACAPLWQRTRAATGGRPYGACDGLPHQSIVVVAASSALVAVALSALLALGAAGTHFVDGAGPATRAFTLTLPSAHDRLLDRFLAEIPPNAAVSTTSALAPHLSHRAKLYLFPNVLDADDVLLDLTANPFPLDWPTQRVRLLALLRSGYGVADAADGYVLLRRGAPLVNLPDAVFSFAVGPPMLAHSTPLATFGGKLALLRVQRDARFVLGSGWQETLTLDLRAEAPLDQNYTLAVWTDSRPRPVPPDFAGVVPALLWRPTSTWQPGELVRVTVSALAVRAPGPLQVGWFMPAAQGVQWLACEEADGRPCPLGTHFVTR